MRFILIKNLAMTNAVNIAVQVIPLSKKGLRYELIDEAIDVIKDSGINHRVCPFETVIEGNYDEIMEIIKRCRDRCFEMGAEEILVNLKIHQRRSSAVTIDEKMEKYK
jgi:uncharacterized protein (TIGR00106 family)